MNFAAISFNLILINAQKKIDNNIDQYIILNKYFSNYKFRTSFNI